LWATFEKVDESCRFQIAKNNAHVFLSVIFFSYKRDEDKITLDFPERSLDPSKVGLSVKLVDLLKYGPPYVSQKSDPHKAFPETYDLSMFPETMTSSFREHLSVGHFFGTHTVGHI
jgi:hypothetical protein